MVARSEGCVCGRSNAGIAGSNSECTWICVVQVAFSAAGRSLVQGSPSVFRCNNTPLQYNEWVLEVRIKRGSDNMQQ